MRIAVILLSDIGWIGVVQSHISHSVALLMREGLVLHIVRLDSYWSYITALLQSMLVLEWY